MVEMLIEGATLPEVYHDALFWLERDGEISECGDWDTIQKEMAMTMVISNPIAEPRISRLFIGGPKELEQYRQEMLDGILDFEVEKGNWAYTYHKRMEDQFQFIVDELKRNPSSRRAVITVRDKQMDMGSNDPACLQHIQFFIRNNKLDCMVLFRSNDACKATFMNAFALICLQERIANALDVEVGTYTHRANSFHCYAKDFSLLDGYVNQITSKDFDDLTFDYKDEWDEIMESYQPEIEAMVEELKTH